MTRKVNTCLSWGRYTWKKVKLGKRPIFQNALKAINKNERKVKNDEIKSYNS